MNVTQLRERSPLGEALDHWQELERDVTSFFVANGWMDFQSLGVEGVEVPQEVRGALDRISRDVRGVFNHFVQSVLTTTALPSDRLERRLQTVQGLLRERVPGDLEILASYVPEGEPGAEANRLLRSAALGLRVLDSDITAEMSRRIEKAMVREILEGERGELLQRVNGIVEAHNESVERIVIQSLRPVEQVDSIAKLIEAKLAAARELTRSLSDFRDQEVALEARRGAEQTRARYESLAGFFKGLTIAPLPEGEGWSSDHLSTVLDRLNEVAKRTQSEELRSLFADSATAATMQNQLASELSDNREALAARLKHLKEIESKLEELARDSHAGE